MKFGKIIGDKFLMAAVYGTYNIYGIDGTTAFGRFILLLRDVTCLLMPVLE